MSWPQQPAICEINAWTWLDGLGRANGKIVTLAEAPEREWDDLAGWGLDAVWLMGVWERSPRGVEIARSHAGLQEEYRRALPDFTPGDVVGSPYAVRRYEVDARLGGREGLASARRELAERGMRLIADFVPNHTATDHPWVEARPDYYVPGQPHGRDPYFPPWTDTMQLNAASPAYRRAAIETLLDIASQADGVRCDMAMLLLSQVFAQTWDERPATEFWGEVIAGVRGKRPDFLFLAEAYWDLEWDLQQQGFDFCYDKRLYERLAHGQAESVRAHLTASPGYQQRLVRFIENHDEPRAAAVFPDGRARAAAVVISTLPGARLYQQGQFEGARVKLPVQLGRRPLEPPDAALRDFYRRLLNAAREYCAGEWRLCDVEGWADNRSCGNLVAWTWRAESLRTLVVVNLSEAASQGRVRVAWSGAGGRQWRLSDPVNGDVWERSGDEIEEVGLFVALEAWGFHFLTFD
ncbi:MAG: alpha-amylase family glycosyl hydrolase [Bryobacterales bacterium]|nr:alpha-amylase family glycosyl hydrolase [Bryobacterales bacterium]